MGISSYKLTKRQRLFQNTPYRLGVNYSDYISIENCAKTIINLNTSSSGEFAFPRASFVNALMTQGHTVSNEYDYDYTPSFPESSIVQETSKGPKFIFGFNFPVNEDDFINDVIDETTLDKYLKPDSFGVEIGRLGGDVEVFNNIGGVVQVAPYEADWESSVIDGDTIYVKPYGTDSLIFNKMRVRFIGIDAPESGTPEGDAAKVFVVNSLESAEAVYIKYEEASELTDDGKDYNPFNDNRLLGYIFYRIAGDRGTNLQLLNAELLLCDHAEMDYITDLYQYYSQMYQCQKIASISNDVDNPLVQVNDSILNVDPRDAKYKHMKKPLYTSDLLNPVIYDSQSFFKATPEAHDFGVILTEDIIIQPLFQEYESQEYGYTQVSKQIPHVNMPWRNAMTFIGRIIENGIVRYKGLITIQYGKIDEEEFSKHYILVQNPKEVNLGAFSNEDAYSIEYNALDDDPFTFVDYFGEDAVDFLRPTVMGVVNYATDACEKPLRSIPSNKKFMLRPYVAIPDGSEVVDYVGDYIRFLINNKPVTAIVSADEDGWIQIDETFDWSVLYRNWELTGKTGEVIVTELKRSYYGINKTETEDSSSGGFYSVFVYKLDTKYKTVGTETINHKITCEGQTLTQVNLGISHESTRLNVHIENTDTNSSEDFILKGKTVKVLPESTVEVYSFEANERVEFEFEGIKYSIKVVSNDNLPNFVYHVSTDYNNSEDISSSASPLIRYSNEDNEIDPQELFDEHNIWNATQVTKWDRYLVLYGEHIGNHSIQFSGFDQTDFFPFPYGQISFDSKVVHVHSHRGNLYVFCEDGLWVLHSGYTYKELIKTFAYSGVTLDPSEKQTVKSFGNEVIFMSGGKGYSIRSNYMVSSQDDIYVQNITGTLNDLISTPKPFIRDRFLEAYNTIIDLSDDLKVQFDVHVVNDNLYLIGSYFVEDPLKSMMVMFKYGRDDKKWIIFDMNVGAFPIHFIGSDGMTGFDVLLSNRPSNGFLTYGTFLYSLPEELGQQIGDVASVTRNDVGQWVLVDDTVGVEESIRPIQIGLNTGNLTLGMDYRKKMRAIRLYFMELESNSLTFAMIPYADGVPNRDPVDISAFIDEDGDIQNEIDANLLTLDSVSAAATVNYTVDLTFFTDSEFANTDSVFTKNTQLVLNSRLNLIGRTIGFKILIPATTKFKIGQYSIRYKALSAR